MILVKDTSRNSRTIDLETSPGGKEMRLPISRSMHWVSASMVIGLAAGTPPVRAEVLLFTEAASAYGTFAGHTCSQQLNSFGLLVRSQCGPIVETGEPGYVTALLSGSQAYSANGGIMGVRTSASVSSNFAYAFQSVQSLALAEVFDNMHFVSQLVPAGAMMNMQVTAMVGTQFHADIAGAVQTMINSDFLIKLNGHTLDVPNFANVPGLIQYTFDAGMIPNGGVVSDFEEMMQTSVEFDRVFSSLPLDASVDLNDLDTAYIASITATFNGQPVTDLVVTGDSGASFPTSQVPEPRLIAPLALSLACLLWRRFQRARARAPRPA